jgi:ribosomal protein S2
MSDISLSQLLELGFILVIKHIAGTKMFPYIYSEVNNIHILDLVQSATCLKDKCLFRIVST